MCLPLARFKLFKSESLTMEDLKRSSSCHNFTSEKAKRRQELNSSPLVKHSARPTLSASSSPQTPRRKHKVSAAISLPLTTFQFQDERLNHVPDSSKHNKETKIHISSGNAPRNTYSRPKLKQTPSIVINSPSSSDRRAVNLTDITVEDPRQEGNVGNFMSGRETGEFSYFNKEPGNSYFSKEVPRASQQQNKEQFIPNREREYEIYTDKEQMFTDGGKQDDVGYRNKKVQSPNKIDFTDNYRNLQRQRARNVSPEERIVSPGARNVSPGTRIGTPTSSDERFDRTDSESQSDKIRTSPSILSERIDNPEGFQRPRPTHINQDASDGSSLYRQRPQYPGSSISVDNSNRNKPRQIPRQSQSESNLKSKTAPERPVYPIVKTFSDPTNMQVSQERKVSNDAYSSETSLVTKNALGIEKPIQGRGNAPVSRRFMNREVEIGRQPEEKYNRDTVPLVNSDRDRQSPNYVKDTLPAARSTNKGHTKNTFQADISTNRGEHFPADNSTNKGTPNEAERPHEGEIFGGLLGETDANHSAEYYDRMISKINEQINLAVSRNKSPCALYGLGSDDDDDWC